MASAGRHLTEAAVHLAWSHWTGLGVAGAANAPDTAVDPESLILFTAGLGDIDPRLRDEATDWCVRFADRFVSVSRLRRLLRAFDTTTRDRFGEFAATVNRYGATKWPTRSASRTFTPSMKSTLTALDTPATSFLRLRCAFGTNARAEILLALMTRWNATDWIHTAVFAGLGYSKRNVAVILDDLAMAGLLATRRAGKTSRVYRLADAGALRKLLKPVPERNPSWHARLPILIALVHLGVRIDGKKPVVQSVEARRLFDHHADAAGAISDLEPAPPDATPVDTYWERLAEWATERLARG
jgi:hypothetical protein